MREREALSLTECVAYLLDVEPSEVPGDGGVGLRQWLALSNVGLVPVEASEDFAWPGRFLGRRRESRTWAVLFGVPPGVVFEPMSGADSTELIDAAFVLAAHNLRRGIGFDRSQPSEPGVVELISVTEEAEGQMLVVLSAKAGRGLEGDRYARWPARSQTLTAAATT